MVDRRAVSTPDAPAAIGPYSQAIVSDGWVYTSGQIALDPKSGELVGGGVKAETEQVMKNLAAVLEAAGANFETVLRTTIFLADMDDFATVNEVYGRYLGDPPPARATVAVRTLPKGVSVEIDAIARVSDANGSPSA
ncbi:MAG: RidA family protein [Planctomycetota bacterium]